MRLMLRRVGRLTLVLALGCGARQEPERRPEETRNPEPPETKPTARPSSVTPRFKELIAALGSDDGEQRQSARTEIFSSGMKWTDGDMEELKAATQSPDAEVAGLAGGIWAPLLKRREIAAGLASLGPEVEDVLFGSGEGRLKLVRLASEGWRAGKVPGPALSRLAELSVDENWGGLSTLESLEWWGAAELCRTQVARLCDSEDARTAAWASRIAERHLIREAAAGICRSLKRVDRHDLMDLPMLIEAAAALGVAEDRTLVERLSVSESPAAREACCDILRRQFRWESADIVLKLASDPEDSVRSAAIRTLCLFGLPNQRDEIIQVGIRAHSFAGADLEAWRGQIDPQSLESLLCSEHATVRRSATWLLQWAHRPEKHLAKAMEDTDIAVQAMAAYAAGRSRCPELVPALIELMKTGPDKAADEAAVSLGWLKARDAVEPLRAFARSGAAHARESGLEGLALLGDAAGVSILVEAYPPHAVESMKRNSAWPACENLALIGGGEALQHLRAIHGPEAALCRLEALSVYGEPGDARLLDAAPAGLIPESCYLWLFDHLGAIPPDFELRIREGLGKRKRLAALGLRHRASRPAAEDLEKILNRVGENPHADFDSVIDSCHVALGRANRAMTVRILGMIRAEGDAETAFAMAEALVAVEDPDSWELWTHEAKTSSDICTAEDAAAFMAERGIKVDTGSCAPFVGRVAAGQIISPRRLSYRIAGPPCPVFHGTSLQFASPEEALRIWAERLAR